MFTISAALAKEPPLRPSRAMAGSVPQLTIKVAIIERSPLDLDFLSAVLGGAPSMALVGAYADVETALSELTKAPIDVVMVDLDATSGLEPRLFRDLHRSLPCTSVLILSSEMRREHVFATLELGVSGWLQKPCSPQQIIQAVRVLRDGGAVLGNQVARHILTYFQARGTSIESLTAREREILGHLGKGIVPSEITSMLGITRDTMRSHIRNILIKLKANSRTEAVAKYLNPSL